MATKVTSTGETTYVASVTASGQTTFVKKIVVGIPVSTAKQIGTINDFSDVSTVGKRSGHVLIYDSSSGAFVNSKRKFVYYIR